MKKKYLLILCFLTFVVNAQTTVNYPQRAANYDVTFSDGGGNFDSGEDQFGMWANFNAKQSVAWRNFTETGLPGGATTTMSVNDSFTISLSATQASYGVIGVALLSSPNSTDQWDDRINNYAVQVNLNGNNGANSPWEVVSAGETVNAFSIGGSTDYTDTKFKFTLLTANTMTVSINDGAETFDVTVNNQNITGYSVYLADDWNGLSNANIYWKQPTEYVYASTLSNEEFAGKGALKLYPNPVNEYFKINYPTKKIIIYNSLGSSIKVFKGDFNHDFRFDLSNLDSGVYLIKILDSKNQNFKKLIIK
jgi:hypothetical protein